MERLIVVSNRTAAGVGDKAGGLAVALQEALYEQGGGLWFGWSGNVLDEECRGLHMITESGIDYALIDLCREEYNRFYLGFSNKALWPVFHYRVDLAEFNQEDYDTYAMVNRRLARQIVPRLFEEDLVWVHDYHFLLLGECLRSEGWEGRMGFFLHIPFPSPETFKSIPEHLQFARALAQFDVLGFQTMQDAANFERYVVDECGAVILPGGRLEIFGRAVSVQAFPIGIDAEKFARLAADENGRMAAEKLERFLGDRALILGVDRMDYSKGLPQRFRAFNRLLDEYPELHGHVSFTQIAPPSRAEVFQYVELRSELDQLAGRLNGDYGDLDWIPIRYLARAYSREQLAALYRLAHVGLVTPLHDGMNLVAKEFVAAQDPDDPGVLVLSEFAGAAEQLDSALIVNPYDEVAVADAIKRAIEMSLEERKSRWQTLHKNVKDFNIVWWRRSFLAALTATPRSGVSARPTPLLHQAKG